MICVRLPPLKILYNGQCFLCTPSYRFRANVNATRCDKNIPHNALKHIKGSNADEVPSFMTTLWKWMFLGVEHVPKYSKRSEIRTAHFEVSLKQEKQCLLHNEVSCRKTQTHPQGLLREMVRWMLQEWQCRLSHLCRWALHDMLHLEEITSGRATSSIIHWAHLLGCLRVTLRAMLQNRKGQVMWIGVCLGVSNYL